jgi:hypothetical protein
MGFKNQLDMVFGMISYTCDMHLELEIVSLMNINYLSKGWNELKSMSKSQLSIIYSYICLCGATLMVY